jgi:recombinational DNA repair protein (RecF pathway)
VFLTDEGCLLRKADSGEHHCLLVFFLKENGLKFALTRNRSKSDSSSTLPDLFEAGDVCLQQKDAAKPAFLREFNPNRRFPTIARHYKTFRAASSLARFYERNLIHMEHFEDAWALLSKALLSFAMKHEPETTLFKTLFIFARMEGYPVQAQWLEGQKPTTRKELTAALQMPVGEARTDPVTLTDAIGDLNRFFAEATDLLPIDLS